MFDAVVNSPQVLAAVVAGGVSVVVTVLTNVYGPIAQRRLERAKGEIQKEIESVRTELATITSEKNARQAYEYETRKRLYEELEPTLFQLHEASENSYSRICSLVRTARNGHLEGEDNWLGHNGYYMRSTIYWLFLPFSLFRLLQSATTFFDLRLDPEIRIKFYLLKSAYFCFTDDFKLARLQPELQYDPNDLDWTEKRVENPAVYHRQALVLGHLDRLTQALSRGSADRTPITFGEFEDKIKGDEAFRSTCSAALDLFIDFSFPTRPVLSRLLIAQAIFHRLILFSYTRKSSIEELEQAVDWFVASEDFKSELRWSDDIDQFLPTVLEYVKERIRWISEDDYGLSPP
ncbi:hypothetical protein [Rhizobium ruizarguesonis]|uniref:hypothetical protein n=1 Tax=Rhizobium ruizarguesonis TaxID=2081791 RepID=UPI00102F4ADB|nr:hypothetical protein [Rhizobium ruizarguesonis]TBE02328.1 hypothetical protein ELH10_15660 [Rhizobium ruizarguesonis]TBF14705.1 hypothetical protein ELG95_14810 [Rhizobium ruizarguesonis]